MVHLLDLDPPHPMPNSPPPHRPPVPRPCPISGCARAFAGVAEDRPRVARDTNGEEGRRRHDFWPHRRACHCSAHHGGVVCVESIVSFRGCTGQDRQDRCPPRRIIRLKEKDAYLPGTVVATHMAQNEEPLVAHGSITMLSLVTAWRFGCGHHSGVASRISHVRAAHRKIGTRGGQ